MLMPSIFEDNFVDRVFDDMFPNSGKTSFNNSVMNVDIQEFDDKYEMEMELPGYAKEDIQADLKDGYLSITAKRENKKEEKDEDGRYIRKERYYGTCQRSFYVGEEITQEDIKASFKDGVLKLDIPKKEPASQVEKKQYIAIE